MRSALAVVRGTVLEGSFGNEKNHYLLDKVKAKTQPTELLYNRQKNATLQIRTKILFVKVIRTKER
jgi:hypothetical protein